MKKKVLAQELRERQYAKGNGRKAKQWNDFLNRSTDKEVIYSYTCFRPGTDVNELIRKAESADHFKQLASSIDCPLLPR